MLFSVRVARKKNEIDNEMKLELLMTHFVVVANVFCVWRKHENFGTHVLPSMLTYAACVWAQMKEKNWAKFPIPIMFRDSFGNLLIEIYPHTYLDV